jgi:phosphoglycolate phosphatase-like HAD superfamily hydrolase
MRVTAPPGLTWSAETVSDHLVSWNPGAATNSVVDFVERTVADHVPVEERVAVFDNDGTLWCEKPLPIQADFILRRLFEMAQADPTLRNRQPWKAAYEHDYAWLGGVIAEHYAGDDTNVRTLLGGVLTAHAGISVEEFEGLSESFLREARHPTLGRRYVDCAYAPMVELLGYLEANGFTNYIASGGDRDFMRPVTEEIYGIPSERVIGSSNALRYLEDEHGGTLTYAADPDVFDDGPVKPVRIWSRIGKRPIAAGGNSNGDIQMLRYAGGKARPSLRLLVLHDDDEREFSYTAGAERSLEQAAMNGWTVVSMKDDWATVFGE